MSALTPKADIDWHQLNVCYVPGADIPRRRTTETERPPRGGLSEDNCTRSAGTLGQASASPKGKVGLVAHRARGDLQCFIGDVEGKYLFLSLQADIHHSIDPFVVLITRSILLVDLLRATRFLILLSFGRTLETFMRVDPAPAAKPVAAGANYLIRLLSTFALQ
jgi:hypothetical protein